MKRLVLLSGLLLSGSVVATAQAVPVPAPSLSSGSWKVNGDVEGVPVILTCAIVETDKVVSGSCTSDDGAIHMIKGKVQDKVVTWTFDSTYQGQPILVTLSGTIDTTGLKMTGSIAVDPLQTDGEFTATKQPSVIPAVAVKPPTNL